MYEIKVLELIHKGVPGWSRLGVILEGRGGQSSWSHLEAIVSVGGFVCVDVGSMAWDPVSRRCHRRSSPSPGSPSPGSSPSPPSPYRALSSPQLPRHCRGVAWRGVAWRGAQATASEDDLRRRPSGIAQGPGPNMVCNEICIHTNGIHVAMMHIWRHMMSKVASTNS